VTDIELKAAIPTSSPLSRAPVVQRVLVIDTSFILSHLQLVDKLVEAYSRWGNTVMLPWATLMELDRLKNSNVMVLHKNASDVEVSVSVGMLARRANSWLIDTMSKNPKVLWSQKAAEVLAPHSAAKVATAILECCWYVKEIKGMRTALLSNDKGLCFQALAYGESPVSCLMSI
jgi:hypothetical protein